jgi:hypothetical protein
MAEEMADNREVVELLREIRDLQKAHFERYKEVTAAIIRREQDAVAARATRDEDARQGIQAVVEETRQVFRDSRRRSAWLFVIFIGVFVGLPFAYLLVSVAISWFYRFMK